MLYKRRLALIPAIMGSLILSSLTAFPAQANDSTILSASSSDKGTTCLDTSSQEKFNSDIESKRIVYPLAKDTYVVTSSFGARNSPILGTAEVHSGTDMAAADRSPIYAVAAGVVTLSGPSSYGGQWVGIRHNVKGKIYDSLYLHLTAGSQSVKVGETVKAGQQIAQEGSTGMSTGPHLHLEIWENGFREKGEKNINSLDWLTDNNATHVNESPNYKELDCSLGEISKTFNVAWGGFKNGEIAEASLKSVSFYPEYKVEKNAAGNLEKMNLAFKAKFNKDIPMIKGYESLENQKKASESLPGKSFFGWGKSIETKFSNATNAYIPLISEPDYFTDAQYVWLNENGKKFGWINPQENQKGSTSPNPNLWIYDEQSNATNKEISLKKYATIAAMSQKWNSSENQKCLTQLWNQDDNWNTSYDRNGEYGISKLDTATIKKYETTVTNYKANPVLQIDIGLKYITDSYGNPCNALSVLNKSNKY